MSVIERIERRVERIPFSGCWIFMGALNTSGYGWVGRGGRGDGVDRAHRITYQHYRGEVPAGKELDHLCRVRSCCNPFHLEAVTRKEHCQRGDVGKTTGAKNRAKTHCPKGHEYTSENTYWHQSRKYLCRGCKQCRSRKKGAARAL